jgi:hypothetical protein
MSKDNNGPHFDLFWCKLGWDPIVVIKKSRSITGKNDWKKGRKEDKELGAVHELVCGSVKTVQLLREQLWNTSSYILRFGPCG